MSVLTELRRLVDMLRFQGPVRSLWAGWDKVHRWTTGGPLGRFSRITDELWLGGQPGPRGVRRLFEAGVTGVVNLRSEYDYEHLVDFGERRYLHLPTDDHEAPTLAHLAEGVDFIREELGRGGRVYLHCWEGIGRGPTLAAAYFVGEGLTPEAAWARLRKVRPFVRPTAKQRRRLEDFAAHYRPGEALATVKARQAARRPGSGSSSPR